MAMQDDHRDYYEVLHVSRDAPLEIIRSSYRMLMQRLKNHPDLGGDPAVAARINEAYAVLKNAEQRVAYDARLDLMGQIARGFPEDQPNDQPESPEEPARILDPMRECVFCETPHDRGSVVEDDAGCQTCGSPLAAAKEQRIGTIDQRAVDRIGKQQKITFYTHWPQRRGFKGHTEDISLNGLRFSTRRDLTKGQRIKIVSDVVEAVAHVTHCIHERRGWATHCVAGVSFITLRFVRSVGGFVSDRV